MTERIAPTTTNLTRRHFLQGSAMAGAAAFLAACGTSGTGGSGAPASAGASTGTGTGDTELRFANWIGYIDTAEDGSYPTLLKFTAETGIEVLYLEDINANEEFFAASLAAPLDAGLPSEWDIVVLTDWMIGRLVRLGWLEAIDKASTPNFVANLAPSYVGRTFDPNTEFAAPWQSGMTGLGFDQAITGPQTSLDVLYTDEFKGKITYLSEMRDTVGLTAITQGADPAALTQAEFDAALAKVDEAIQSGIVRQVAGGNYIESMAAGDVVLAIAWSGDVAGLLVPDQTEEQDFQWYLADEGGMLWTDNMAIPLGSPNKVAAEKWIDFYYDPVNAAAVEAYVNYVCPVVGAREVMIELDPEAAENPLIFPPEDWVARLHQFRATTADEETAWSEAYTKIMGL